MKRSLSLRERRWRHASPAARRDAHQTRRAAIVMIALVVVWDYAWVLSKLGSSYWCRCS